MSTSLPVQNDIFGEGSTQIHTLTLTRRLMKDNPVLWRSHRLLMRAIAKEIGFNFELLSSEQRHKFEQLIDISPDVERAARKVREESGAWKADQIAANTPYVENGSDTELGLDEAVESVERRKRFTRR
jgi:hypothetical protein